MEIEYRVASVSDTAEIIDFLQEHFFKDEPICASMKWDEKDDVTTAKLRPLIAGGTCFLAIARTSENLDGELAGVRIGGPHIQDEDDLIKPDNVKWTILMRFLEELDRQTQFGQRYNLPAEKIFYGLMLGVNRKFRGQSIGIQLYKKSMALAKSLGYALYACDCTSFYSARLCEKLDMDLVNVLPFTEYCDAAGKQIFDPALPHKATKSFAKLL